MRIKEEGAQPPQQPLVLVDPMAGSGTLVVEAVLMAADVAPGLMRAARSTLNPRAFPGQRVPPVARWKRPQNDDISKSAALRIWEDELSEASRRAEAGIEWLRSSRSVRFLANDRHPGAVDLIESSLREANRVLPGLDSLVEVHQGDCAGWRPLGGANSGSVESDSSPEKPRWMVVTNPPWGERLSEDMHGAWESLRAFLRGGACPPGGAEAWVLSGNPAATRHLGLQRSASVPIKTGQQDLRWLRYEIRDKSSPPSPGSFQAPQPREGMGVARQQVNRADSLKRERFQRASFASSRKAPAATRSKQDRPNRNRSAASTRANPPPAKRSPSENEWLT
jgi:23S rRNA G2445 N2-methylase RlmL